MADDIATTRVFGTWWRQLPAGLEPSSRPARLPNARWQGGRVVDAIYLADSPDAAWAEWYRWLAESALAPRAALPRDLWRVEVALDDVVDLPGPAALEAAGLHALRPDRGDWPEFQAVGERLHAGGRAAVVAPSAARERGAVLCIFWPPAPDVQVSHGSHERTVEPPAPPRGLRT
jgi:RES domain-containing protein